ncbi:bestrophin-like domain [Dyadobacter sediminis]|uniref:DUF4239 domain-containing protein n=1 Tax=Dyadobacter sediminis TaxID=1493691 RepID=A0A5R9KBZ4_9BACT|nr:DUF4239 domain-containing protein [Dyadobacter sediminis]TLU92217.1 DUF4239 domain-containing protein [Dyadobacter sediminis]GGB96460.1 hypothetical protein GCM10011325_24720 [Dyadobacter sediminis]
MVSFIVDAEVAGWLPAPVLCLLFVLFCVLVAQLGLSAFKRFVKLHLSQEDNELAGIMFGAIGLIYSLILAFVIIAVWDDYDELSKTIEEETDKLNGIMAHTGTLPDSLQMSLKTAMIGYCRQVLQEEWRMNGPNVAERPSAIPSLRLALLRIEPSTKTEESIYAVVDQDLSKISELRRKRLSYARSHIPDLVWFTLQTGSLLLIVFSYFLTAPSDRVRRISLGFFSGYLAMCMFLIYTLDRPFGKVIQVSRQPYANVLMSLKQYYAVNL